MQSECNTSQCEQLPIGARYVRHIILWDPKGRTLCHSARRVPTFESREGWRPWAPAESVRKETKVWMNAFVKEEHRSWQWPQHNAFAYCGSPFFQHPNFHVGDTVDARGILEVAIFMSMRLMEHGQGLKAWSCKVTQNKSDQLMTSILELFTACVARRFISTPPMTSDFRGGMWVWCLFHCRDARQEACFDFSVSIFFPRWVWYTLTKFSWLVK